MVIFHCYVSSPEGNDVYIYIYIPLKYTSNILYDKKRIKIWLAVWNTAEICSPIVGMMIQSDFHTFQEGWNQQPDIPLIYQQYPINIPDIFR